MTGTAAPVGRSTRQTGKVAWFNNDKGWGFLTPDAGGPDVFVHYTGITAKHGKARRTLEDNDLVGFDVIMGPEQRPQAVNVIVTGRAPMAADAGEGTPYRQ